MIRGILAVFAGLIFIAATSTGIDAVLHATGVLPRGPLFDTGLLLLAAAYRSILSVIGCYITARLAPDRPLKHALALGVVGMILSAAGMVVGIKMKLGPVWYPLALVAASLPCAWLGGRLFELRPRERFTDSRPL